MRGRPTLILSVIGGGGMKDLNVIEAQLTRVLSFFPRVDTKVAGLFTVNSAVLTISALNVQAGDL
jgi:hypothetical protein